MNSLLEFYVMDLVKSGLIDVSELDRDSKLEILQLMQRKDNAYDVQDAIYNFLRVTRKGDHPKNDVVMKLLEDLICQASENAFDELVDLLQDEIIDYYRSHLQCMIYDAIDSLYPERPEFYLEMPLWERQDYLLSPLSLNGE